MPRVTADHLTARRQQILDAARECFARNGFHATSMQDVLRAAGLSAGAVYRYFPSKAAIVEAIAGEVAGWLSAELREALAADPVPAIDEVLDRVLAATGRYEAREVRIAIQVWGEALRDPTLHEVAAGAQAALRDLFVEVVRRAAGTGQFPPGADPAEVGAALFALLPGFLIQRMLTGIDREPFMRGVRALLPACR